MNQIGNPIGAVLTAIHPARVVREQLEEARAKGHAVKIAITSTNAEAESIELFVRYIALTEAVCTTVPAEGSSPVIVSLGNSSEQDTKRPTIVIGRAPPS